MGNKIKKKKRKKNSFFWKNTENSRSQKEKEKETDEETPRIKYNESNITQLIRLLNYNENDPF